MADSKITGLTADTSPTSDDLTITVTDPAGTPVNRKVTAGDLITKAHGLGNGMVKIAAGTMAIATAGTDYGAGNVGVDIIVAPSGGDYTTLGAALAAASSGQTIFVRSGTYTEVTQTITTTNLTVIGENPETTVVGIPADWTLSGAGLTLFNIQFSISGNVTLLLSTGVDKNISGCTFKSSNTTTGAVTVTGNNYRVSDCRFEATGASSRSAFSFGGSYNTITGCTFEAANLTDIAANATVRLIGNNQTFVGNSLYYSGTTASAVSFLSVVNDYHHIISDNYFYCAGGLVYAIYITGSVNGIAVSSNFFRMTNGSAIYINSGCDYVTATGNIIQMNTTSTTNAIYIDGSNCNINGNTIYNGTASAQTGIYINAARDNTVINGNRINSFSTGINISASTCDNTHVTGNNLIGNTTPISDSGTASEILDNTPVPPTLEKNQFYMKNTSGVQINAGEVVILKAVAAGDEVTTTTTAGDDKVFGVATANIANNAYGYIQTLGKVTNLKADGTVDIAVGDLLCTSTTAGVCQKDASGDQAFAIALEAYTANDANGVIDALLITPRFS